MDVNLFKDLLVRYPDAISSQSRLQAMLNDTFPGERLEIRLIVSAYEMGIANEIKRSSLDNSLANRFIKRLEDDYGIDSSKARQAVLMWCEAYGVGVLKKSSTINLPNASTPSTPPSAQTSAPPKVTFTSASGIQWRSDNTIKVNQTRPPKKITGTRFPDVLGINPFKTPFEVWCALTRTYEEPFVDNQFTIAGKTIEPKQFDYARKRLYKPNLQFVAPTDVFGPNPFKTTYGDFFREKSIFGGMWDYLIRENGRTVGLFEMKTTNEKNAPFWRNDLPEMNTLQAALYAWLLNVDQFYMVSSFLRESDYNAPSSFMCGDSNTIITPFKLSQKYPNFEKTYIAPVTTWWNNHVVTGISPQFDETRDAKILAELRKR